MEHKIIPLAAGTLTLSRVVYHCDLQKSGLVIPLATMAEITYGGVRVLGMMARTGLTELELGKIGGLLRHHIAAPFDFLEEEFDWAWENTEAGRALGALADRHKDSLFFSPPKSESFRSALAASGGIVAAEAAREELRRRRDDEFLAMVQETLQEQSLLPSRVTELAA